MGLILSACDGVQRKRLIPDSQFSQALVGIATRSQRQVTFAAQLVHRLFLQITHHPLRYKSLRKIYRPVT